MVSRVHQITSPQDLPIRRDFFSSFFPVFFQFFSSFFPVFSSFFPVCASHFRKLHVLRNYIEIFFPGEKLDVAFFSKSPNCMSSGIPQKGEMFNLNKSIEQRLNLSRS